MDHHPALQKGLVDSLPSNEIQFWDELIDKYLYPLDKDAEVSAVISAVHFPTLNITIF
jgi:chitin synthase